MNLLFIANEDGSQEVAAQATEAATPVATEVVAEATTVEPDPCFEPVICTFFTLLWRSTAETST